MEPRVVERPFQSKNTSRLVKDGSSQLAGAASLTSDVRLELICLAVFVALASLVFFFGLGNFPLFNPDESFYAEPAREMLDTHDYITTTLNYAVRYTKPPLFMWVAAACYELFGQNEFAARFYSACSGTALVGITFSMLARFINLRTACLGAVILITGPLFVVTGRMAIADMSLALFVAGSLFCFFRAFREKDQKLIWLGYILIALSVMTKGPVGVALPVLVLGTWHLVRGNLLQGLKFYKPHSGALLVALLALPWFIVETVITKGEYFNCFIIMENFQRFTRVVSGHKGHWYYHLVAIGAGLLPWSVLLPQALFGALYQVRTRGGSSPTKAGSAPAQAGVTTAQTGSDAAQTGVVTAQAGSAAAQAGSTPSKGGWLNPAPAEKLQPIVRFLTFYRTLSVKQDFVLFSACAAVIIVLFFSASTSKLLSYTLPAFPFLAAVIAIELDNLIDGGRELSLRLFTPFILFATVYGAASLVAPMVLSLVHRAPSFLGGIVVPYCALQFAVLVAVLGLFIAKRRLLGTALFCASTFVGFCIFGYSGLSAISNQWEGPVPDFARFAALSNEPIFVYKVRLPSVTFYTHRPAVLSPAQERPIPGTNRFTGVAGEPEPPSIPLLRIKAPDVRFKTPELTVEEAITRFDRAYIIARKTDDAFFVSHPGFKIVAHEGLFILVHWIKP